MGDRRQPSKLELDELKAFLDSIRSGTIDLIFAPTDGGALYHYTDLNGLIGIVSEADLWLTHSKYSNDDQELTRGRDIAKSAIAIARSTVPSPGADWIAFLNEVERLIDCSSDDVYVTCFCKADDLLSQWRGYAANGVGVSIKFTPTGFSEFIGVDSPHGGLMRLWKVFYAEEQQKKIMASALTFAYAYVANEPVTTKARRAADAITFFVPTFKDEAFSDEREWRLIFTPAADCPIKPRFRARGGMLMPYYSLRDLAPKLPEGMSPKLPIAGVTVGPSIRQALNVRSTEAILAAARYDKITTPVVASPIPFRG